MYLAIKLPVRKSTSGEHKLPTILPKKLVKWLQSVWFEIEVRKIALSLVFCSAQ